MKRIFNQSIIQTLLLVAAGGFFLSVIPGAIYAAESHQYINVSNPLRKMPVAVPVFKAMSGSEEEIREGRTSQLILTDALNFTGYLKTLNPVSFLSNPAQTGIQLGQINFRDWTGIGADYLVTGGIFENAGQIKLELRFFDTVNTKLLVGTAYTGPKSMIRTMIHKFCGEICFALTGKYGVFGSKITFVSKNSSGHKEIFNCDFDGENIKQITHDKSINLSPAWSHDKNWIAYVSYARRRPEIFIKNLGGKRGTIFNFKGMNNSPTWMPDKPVIAAALSFSGDPEIYLLTIDGEIIKRVTNSLGIDASPSFSPDGSKIAFTSKRTGTPQIFIQDIESGIVKRLTYVGANNTSPAWSPDGTKIAYVGIEDNHINIYVQRIGSDVPVQLTMNQGDNEDPSWSPDASMIVFSSTREGGVPRLFVMNASGTDQRRLLTLAGAQTQPEWSE